MASYKTGERLRSRVSQIQVVVVKAADSDADITCDGVALAREGEDLGDTAAVTEGPKVDIGKRYEDEEGTVELLCVTPGFGQLSLGDKPLNLKAPKPLPASD